MPIQVAVRFLRLHGFDIPSWVYSHFKVSNVFAQFWLPVLCPLNWWRGRDSNSRLPAYETGDLGQTCQPRYDFFFGFGGIPRSLRVRHLPVVSMIGPDLPPSTYGRGSRPRALRFATLAVRPSATRLPLT